MPATTKDATGDLAAAIEEIWPNTDALSHDVVARLIRLVWVISVDLDAVAADFGISVAALEALAALRLAPSPHRLSQRALGEQLMRTSGTLSVRLTRLEHDGLIRRVPDPYDTRGVIVELTARGRKLIDRAMAARFEAEEKLLSGLSRTEQRALGGLLRTVDVVTSNIPGVPIPLYLAGARMEAQYPFGPRSGAAVNITLLSYLDSLFIGVNTDPVAVPDHGRFMADLADGFNEVLKVE